MAAWEWTLLHYCGPLHLHLHLPDFENCALQLDRRWEVYVHDHVHVRGHAREVLALVLPWN